MLIHHFAFTIHHSQLIMTETWTHYLQKNGAQFENNTIIDFGQPEEER